MICPLIGCTSPLARFRWWGGRGHALCVWYVTRYGQPVTNAHEEHDS